MSVYRNKIQGEGCSHVESIQANQSPRSVITGHTKVFLQWFITIISPLPEFANLSSKYFILHKVYTNEGVIK